MSSIIYTNTDVRTVPDFFASKYIHLMKQNNVGSDQLASYPQLFFFHSNDGTGNVSTMKPADLYLYSL